MHSVHETLCPVLPRTQSGPKQTPTNDHKQRGSKDIAADEQMPSKNRGSRHSIHASGEARQNLLQRNRTATENTINLTNQAQ